MNFAELKAEIEKEIEEIIKICMDYRYSREETIKDLNDENSDVQFETKKEFLILTSKLMLLRQAEQMVRDAIKHAYDILENNKMVAQQSKKMKHIIRYIEQREDELCLVYSDLFNTSVNEAKQNLGISDDRHESSDTERRVLEADYTTEVGATPTSATKLKEGKGEKE